MFRIMMLLVIGLVTRAAIGGDALLDAASTNESFATSSTMVSFEFDPSDVALAAVGGDDPFAEGSRVWHARAAGSFGDNEGELYSAHFGVGWYFVDDLSINLSGLVMWADADKGDDAIGGGLDLVFRWHFYHHGRWSIYGDVGGGVVWFDDDFPPGGTEFNFTLHAGLGATYALDNDLLLMFGVQWYHLSNARIEGRDRNVGYDGLGVYLGVMKPF